MPDSPLVSVNQLRNKSTQEIENALFRDGFELSRKSSSSSRAYVHPGDKRRVFIHWHRGSDTIPRGTLGNIINSTGWTEEDAKRLKLI